MKKLSLSIIVALFAFILTDSATAQIQAGAGFAYGSEIEELGLQVNGTYQITDNIRAAADFVYFFVEDPPGGSFGFNTLNLNGHYIIPNVPNINAYALAGLNFAFTSTEFTVLGNTVDDSSTELGLNIGAGAEFGVGPGNIFAEIKYVLGDADQLVIGAGYRIGIGN